MKHAPIYGSAAKDGPIDPKRPRWCAWCAEDVHETQEPAVAWLEGEPLCKHHARVSTMPDEHGHLNEAYMQG